MFPISSGIGEGINFFIVIFFIILPLFGSLMGFLMYKWFVKENKLNKISKQPDSSLNIQPMEKPKSLVVEFLYWLLCVYFPILIIVFLPIAYIKGEDIGDVSYLLFFCWPFISIIGHYYFWKYYKPFRATTIFFVIMVLISLFFSFKDSFFS